MELSPWNGSRVMLATAVESLAFSAARNLAMKPSNSLCKAGEATAFFGAWADAGAASASVAASTILDKIFMGNSPPGQPVQIYTTSGAHQRHFGVLHGPPDFRGTVNWAVKAEHNYIDFGTVRWT